MIYIFLGYMGSGKSTIAQQVAKKCQLDFVDLDKYIEAQEGMSIEALFKTKGEIYFRRQEHVNLKALLERTDDFVLALGGGTPCYAGNMDLIKASSHTTSFYLKAKIPTIVERLWAHRGERPLLAHVHSKEDLTEFVGKHLFERSPYYSQAHTIFDVDTLSVDSATAQLSTSVLDTLQK